jgi:hypothetical protein
MLSSSIEVELEVGVVKKVENFEQYVWPLGQTNSYYTLHEKE